MPRFLAVYTMKHEDFAAFRNLAEAEQDAINTIGVAQWAAWEERNAAVILDRGGMVRKTTRINRDGVTDGRGRNRRCRSTAFSRSPAHHRLPGRWRGYHALLDLITRRAPLLGSS